MRGLALVGTAREVIIQRVFHHIGSWAMRCCWKAWLSNKVRFYVTIILNSSGTSRWVESSHGVKEVGKRVFVSMKR